MDDEPVPDKSARAGAGKPVPFWMSPPAGFFYAMIGLHGIVWVFFRSAEPMYPVVIVVSLAVSWFWWSRTKQMWTWRGRR